MRYVTGVRPYTLLDLYCGAGGASVGYHRAGFNVIGVDLHAMPRYPFEFVQCDALEYLKTMIERGRWRRDARWQIDAIHASPPCQRYSIACTCRPGLAEQYPDLIEPTRELCELTGLPYVIENVPRAPLVNPVTLCGTQFGLASEWKGQKVVLRRHREFEAHGFEIPDAGEHDHSYRAVPVYGHGAPTNAPFFAGEGLANIERRVMDINWMTRDELDEAIPPAYTEYVGKHLMTALTSREGLELAA
jgi:DNA (cytosine-5)-methyltransferase 1